MENKKPILKFKVNIPAEVELTFDEPREGESEYGKWFMYGCKHEGEEKIFFPTKTLHTMIQLLNFRKGGKFTVLKAEQDDGKNKFMLNGKDCNQIYKEAGGNNEDKQDNEPIPF